MSKPNKSINRKPRADRKRQPSAKAATIGRKLERRRKSWECGK